MTTTDNKTADMVNAIISGVNSAGVQFVETLAIADVPWLGLPVIKQVFEYLVSWLGTYVSKGEQTGVTFGIIDIQVTNEEAGLATALKNLIAAQKSGDPNAINAAIQAYANAHSALINSNGSSTPTG